MIVYFILYIMLNVFFDIKNTFGYPPTEDQLVFIGWFFNNIWILRIISLTILILTLYFWYKVLVGLVGKIISLVSCLIIILSPTFYILWLTSPIDCLKIFILIFFVFVLNKNIKHFGKLTLIIGSIYIILFSFLSTTEKSSFVHKLGLKDARTEVQKRFAAEDSLTDPVKVPLNIKRIVYNKYFFAYKEVINEIIPFFDMESLFFQEIHPMEQKSIVIFVWPEIFLLIGGVYFLLKYKNNNINSLIIVMLFFSFINYLFDPLTVFKKFEFILFPFSLIMALTVGEIYKSKILFGKVFGFVVIFFCLYGTIANFTDLNKRPDYWLDNRPYFYEFVFSSIKKRDLSSFQKIYITSLVGKTDKYCKYYLDNCDSKKFVFSSFELENRKPDDNSIYAGFAGEFIGSHFKNDINKDWLVLVKDKGFTEIDTLNIRDTIAYKFGNDVVIGEFK